MKVSDEKHGYEFYADLATRSEWEPTDQQIDAVGELVFESWGELGEESRRSVRWGLQAAHALAVADADAPDGEFEGALDAYEGEACGYISFGAYGDRSEYDAARARVLALHRSAEQKGLRELQKALHATDFADSDGTYMDGVRDVLATADHQIDAMLKEDTNG